MGCYSSESSIYFQPKAVIRWCIPSNQNSWVREPRGRSCSDTNEEFASRKQKKGVTIWTIIGCDYELLFICTNILGIMRNICLAEGNSANKEASVSWNQIILSKSEMCVLTSKQKLRKVPAPSTPLLPRDREKLPSTGSSFSAWYTLFH